MIATSQRGMYMGNRGCIHDDQGQIRRSWKVKHWILCKLAFKGRKRLLMAPCKYTELFFLDEATALVADHRPCAECRRADYNCFKQLWTVANHEHVQTNNPGIDKIDVVLHHQRIDGNGQKVTYEAKLGLLTDRVLVKSKDRGNTHLIYRNFLYTWSPGGYLSKRPIQGCEIATVLTSALVVKTIQAGFPVGVHPSVDKL